MVDYKNNAFGLLLEKAYLDGATLDVKNASYSGTIVKHYGGGDLLSVIVKDEPVSSGFFFKVYNGDYLEEYPADVLGMEDYVYKVLDSDEYKVEFNEVKGVGTADVTLKKNKLVKEWNDLVRKLNNEVSWRDPNIIPEMKIRVFLSRSHMDVSNYSLRVIGNSPVGLDILSELISRVVNSDYSISRLSVAAPDLFSIDDSVRLALNV